MNKQNNENKKDEVVLELNFTITSKTYKFSLATRKAWVVELLILGLRLAASLWNEAHLR